MKNIDLNNIKRIVFKFGTNVLRNDEGYISLARIYSFIEAIAKYKKMGKEVLVVTSGAVGLGAKKINATDLSEVSLKQACAAIGQSQLMSIYEDGFSKFDIVTAQILLTEEDFSNRRRYLNLRSTLDTLLKYNVIPIINENDTVSSDELKLLYDVTQISFSDNDKLSALVASELDADLLIILSDINGLYDDNPKTNPNANFIHEVFEVTKEIESLGLDASKGGRGGMKTKLQAAKIVTRSGCGLIIANGKTPNILNNIFNTKEKTIFYPVEENNELNTKKRWIAYATTIIGKLVVNAGAKKAIIEKESSLLPIGVTKVVNNFKKGDIVSIIDEDGEEFARGIINYNSEDTNKIIGKHSDSILEILGYKNYDALITRDYIVLL
ncbi:glutamate 5-kinase [Brachyspira pilosicoli]|uniref:Glutamate 5-kinase n=4 Tax=Brachyspira pilosicoli TaxID=52584 RepID=D8IFF6_BRAP9|nr:glutamate 5-kinase [Brachyspira pilosicoli]ADK31879.1 glutamate-5-kinase [Brachyspira pilosicoli 95/1000]AGA66383.1 glutamate-5-kinase [Brachyspira pilosicoli P43/6/78]MBW5383297.1 glutamate 5-kinase [Brachyspira pilosicoli]MBW5392932.1 glutamate 5-kinase [Brachyspira pilosicoli]MBW5398672.1 glutamate 5-kinase [Brachyspira pilosicoli]